MISRSKAEKYFGAEDALGKTLTYGGKTDFTVSGVMEDVPANSHFIFDADIHLRSQIARDPTHLGDITSLYLCFVIAAR